MNVENFCKNISKTYSIMKFTERNSSSLKKYFPICGLIQYPYSHSLHRISLSLKDTFTARSFAYKNSYHKFLPYLSLFRCRFVDLIFNNPVLRKFSWHAFIQTGFLIVGDETRKTRQVPAKNVKFTVRRTFLKFRSFQHM